MKYFFLAMLCLGFWQCSNRELGDVSPVPEPDELAKDSTALSAPRLITAPNAIGWDVALDAASNIYVVGSYFGTVTFGNSTLTAAGNTDMYIAKYNAAGAFQWVKSIGGAGYDEARGVAVDAGGNAYLTGDFEGPVSVGNNPVSGRGSQDVLIAKFNPDGEALWARSAGSEGGERGHDIAIDGNGNAYVTGEFQGTGVFGNVSKQSAGEFDAFVAKYNTDGAFQWVQTGGGAGRETGYGIAADARTGDVYVTGAYFGTTAFGNATRTSEGDADAFFAKYNTDGKFQWMQSIGGSGSDSGKDIAVDGTGAVYVTGQNSEPVGFSGGSGGPAGNVVKGFLARFDANGVIQWGRDLIYNVEGMGVAVDESGNAYVVSLGSVILRYKPDGTAQRMQSPTGGISGGSIAVNPNKKLYVTGFYENTITFGGISKSREGALDMFVVGGDL